MNETTESDNQLMLRAKNGELDCLNTLFGRYQPILVSFFRNQSCHLEIARDLTQDTFWRILKYRESFNHKHSFKSWMFQIARNIYWDHLKRSQRLSFVGSEGMIEAEAHSNIENGEMTLDQDLEHKEAKKQLEIALSKLSPEKREILILARFENLPYKEIAMILNCSISNVKIRVYRAINELKDIYEKLSFQPQEEGVN